MALTMWLPRPCDMKPAPIRATRMGRPSASRAFNALSTIIMMKFPVLKVRPLGMLAQRGWLKSYFRVFARSYDGRFSLSQAHAPLEFRFLLFEQLPDCVLL